MPSIFDDLDAEEEALDAILTGLPADALAAPSGAAGWSVADVVLHLAQTEEAIPVALGGTDPMRAGRGAGRSTDELMAALVRGERADPEQVVDRWRAARRRALAALRQADPRRPVPWVAAELKPPTLATTRLAEHWAHALDITGGLGLPYPDTDRLRHVAWLGHGTLPYAFALAGMPPHPVFCELLGPGGSTWHYGPPDAPSRIIGTAAAFCRVGAQRLAPAESGLITEGPHGAAALRVLRTYAG